jgi:transglutaminase-like putative cysteine protease
VTLKAIPPGSGLVRLWIPFPGDNPAQRVLNLNVASAPGPWKIVRETEHGNRFLFVEVQKPSSTELSTILDFTVRREPVRVQLDPSRAGRLTAEQRAFFAEELRPDVPLMQVTDEIKLKANQACGIETNIVLQAQKLFEYVADYADHYSKDPTKPRCGRGAAEDCLAQKGGCCTDLHSLFIALARSRGIPARLQMGLRVQPQNEGKDVDPGYRCWVEYFVPGYGWIPTDIVAGDAGGLAERQAYVSGLDDRRLWYCEGRNFELTPRQEGGRVNTVIVGYAEIDGKRVPVLPAADGTPSPLVRTLRFTERRGAAATGGIIARQ